MTAPASPSLLNFCVKWCGAVLAFAGVAGVSAQVSPSPHAAISIQPVPEWVAPAETAAPSSVAGEAGQTVDYLIVDSQVNVIDEAYYYRRSLRVSQAAGLQEAGEISFDFDPAYQTLDLHYLRVIRDGVASDRLRLADFEVIRQERDRERALYDGRLTAILQLSDLRVGDTIDYAATLRGRNPVYAGHYADSFGVGWAVPVAYFRHRLITSETRPLHFKTIGDSPFTATQLTVGGQVTWEWSGHGLAAITTDGEAPFWYPNFPYVEVSEFAEWNDVARWALPLYDDQSAPFEADARRAAKAPADDAVDRMARELSDQYSTPEDRVLAALDFVQEEVRYLGIELGAGSHRPRAPAATLASRFGDCKDKALLLCALLRRMGIECAPALVDTSNGPRLLDHQPSPNAFDHVITWVRLPDGRDYWLDGTATDQDGNLAQHSSSDLGYALLVLPGEFFPRKMKVPPAALPRIVENWVYQSPALDAPAGLQITTTYYGQSAPGMRAWLNARTAEEIQRDYLNYVARQHPDVTATAPVTWTNDPINNIVATVESYENAHFWAADETDGGVRAELYPLSIGNLVTKPASPVRRTPLRLSHPVDTSVVLTVELPEAWPVTPFDREVTTPHFSFHSLGRIDQRTLHLEYRYRSLAAFVETEDVAAHTAELARINDRLGYELPHTDPADSAVATAEGFRLNQATFWTAVIVSAAGLFFLRQLWSPPSPFAGLASPPPLPAQATPPLGGWLVLPAISLVIGPFIPLATLVTQGATYFDGAIWDALGRNSPHGLATQQLLVFEVAGHTALVWIRLITVRLFFTKRQNAPRWVIAGILFPLVFTALDVLIAEQWAGIALDAEDTADLGRGIVGAVVWIPYFLISKRVKSTFIR